jgi:hypothetical protein
MVSSHENISVKGLCEPKPTKSHSVSFYRKLLSPDGKRLNINKLTNKYISSFTVVLVDQKVNGELVLDNIIVNCINFIFVLVY